MDFSALTSRVASRSVIVPSGRCTMIRFGAAELPGIFIPMLIELVPNPLPRLGSVGSLHPPFLAHIAGVETSQTKILTI